MLHNPKWLQIGLYLIVTGLVAITGLLFYWAAIIVTTEAVLGGVPILFFAGAFAYVSSIVITLVPYIPARLTHTESGFTITLGERTRRYRWSDISAGRNHGVCRIFQILDSDAKLIFVVCHWTPGYKKFEDAVSHGRPQ